MLFALVGVGWITETPSVTVSAPGKTIKATLVKVEKKKPKARPKPKPKPKSKPKPKPKPKISPEPQKVNPPEKVLPKPDLDEIRRQQQAEKRAAAEQAFAELLEDEDADFQAGEDAGLILQYVASMQAAIVSNWSRPPSARRNMQVLLTIRLVPNGDVVSVNVKDSAGDLAFDRSAELAVQKVGRFTGLQGMPRRLFEKNFRQLDIRFKPEDLRL